MIKVFHSPRSRSLRVIWMLEEMGLPYEVEPGSLMAPSEAFLKASPARTLPAMVDGVLVAYGAALETLRQTGRR